MSLNYQITENLKTIMRGLPVPIAIITAQTGNTKRGITISSFTCLSMNPPLISFNIDCKSQFCSFFKSAKNFAIHFPEDEHVAISSRFATSGLSEEEQFADLDYFEDINGIPVFNSIKNVIHCSVFQRIEMGDHNIIIGDVHHVKSTQKSHALLYHNKAFKTLNTLQSV